MLLALACTFVAGEGTSSLEANGAPPLALVRFACDERELARRMERRTWSAPEVESELARGWVSVRRESCESQRELASLTGERGSLVTCALDARGDVIGVLAGHADAARCAEFLRGCRALADERPDELERTDARIALGVRGPLERELACALEALDPLDARRTQLTERLARLCVLRGEPRAARSWLALADGSARGVDGRRALTLALLALVERDTAGAVLHARALALALGCTREAHSTVLELASQLHEAGADDAALELAAALEATSPGEPAQRSIDVLREHVLRSPTGHTH